MSADAKERAELAYELYSRYLEGDLGHPQPTWDELPETIRAAWRITIKTIIAMVPKERGR